MSQGIVEAGDWRVCGVYVSVNCRGWGKISVQVDCSVSSRWSRWLSVIGGISDPTVLVPFVSEIFWAKIKL